MLGGRGGDVAETFKKGGLLNLRFLCILQCA